MKRYLEIERIVYQELEKNCFGNKKRQGYRHLFGVSTLCIAYSQYVQLDCELCAIMGLLHDYSVYKNNTSFNHAQLSSELARKMLEESLLFENEEINIIVQAIKNHSTKNKVHDQYSELLKMCDVLETYYHDPNCIFDEYHQKFIEKASLLLNK
nr:HD domain-containing protein [uncultured Faecalibacillus sp.]